MTSNKLIESQILQEDDPDYGPLEAVLGPDSRDDFEWRAEAELADHTHIQAYKYDRTGHYLHLSADADLLRRRLCGCRSTTRRPATDT